MTPESLSIPIAPATGCCSENAPAADSLPVVTTASQDGCCVDQAVTGAAAETCEQQATPAAGDIAPVAESDVAPDEAALIDALRQVVDPELMINIVDLGLVYSINQTDQKVLVEMTLTSPACPAGPQIVSQAKMSVEKLPGVKTAEIKLTMSPPWTPDRMTDDARDQLGIF